ncbi:rhomboid family protease [Schizosaccharomyces octosporus yFS286]|uniref:Rhomboid family protease n=1 Tax=Schizosaccharomyces octosporus (strain yFS286) TaxID=483514 RepID=S9R7D9_SCHOY|nr:rhomboid family protease [Schizosaccharomyces octosporus yFS286]EPX74130.1 rhomboid family protease [Schizosaccharomyces octosporus yFS286]
MNLSLKASTIRKCPRKSIFSSCSVFPMKVIFSNQNFQSFSAFGRPYSLLCKPLTTRNVACPSKQKWHQPVDIGERPSFFITDLSSSISKLPARRYFSSSSHIKGLPNRKTNFLFPSLSEHRSGSEVAKTIAILVCITNGLVFWLWDLAKDDARTLHDFKRLDWMLRNTQCSLQNLYDGRWWTLITSLFSHQNLTHLLVNCFAIYSFMPLIVHRFGILRSFSVYFLSGIMGNFVVLERLLRKDEVASSKGSLHVWDVLFNKESFSETQSWLAYIKNKFSLSSFEAEKNIHTLSSSWRKGVLGASGSVYGIMALFACTYPLTQFLLFFIIPAQASTILPLDFLVESLLLTQNYDETTGIAFDAHVTGMILGTLSSFLLIPKVWRSRFIYRKGL